ncbi:MAG: L-glutamate gamma-semialdehyde dehydrogenase [Saprospiraceae bacterium]|nr:MAG: delta-1-pyrroline-5-carboxylate dehydrogenase, group 1 [Candidatus Parvibacillus calidus]MBX2936730.1 L-glutamate gamma-semialdehyde dehydrogenase [Saprospiraceae bacterium]MBK7739537.1 L-glutamate gamma-semialdehyde dehydrogenase [Candidatus Parvibacillus calidus]MBX7178477.1 L-glutamate gamma-semialdehyde dehydrogenase [Saprospiraceae bacterium]MCB0589981.1 L-glutamate gamma-semialdehyde dehydrogenase [Saprospiraceae bacterium]
MSNAIFKTPRPVNEVVRSYAPGTEDRKQLEAAIKEAKSKTHDIPMYIGGKEVRTDNKVAIRPPHEIKHTLAYYHKGDENHVKAAIDAALGAKAQWSSMPWEHRAAIFLKAAELIAGPYRMKINAATMLGQSKNAFQAEIDSACELIDFLRFNVEYMTEIYKIQPESSPGIWNRLEWRPLEGFVFALTPFNFTAIAGNLPSSPALMGNTVVWKPSETQIFAANVIMEVFREAGLPDGVINLVFVSGAVAGDVIFSHRDFAGLHFTGGTSTFNTIYRKIASHLDDYRSYPRIVGETGGKDFVMVHKSANPDEVAVALARGAFEYQGQKCSAASRAYIPRSLWPAIKERLQKDVESMKMGSTEDFSNFINAVIDKKAFDFITSYIDRAKQSDVAKVIIGGEYDDSEGYFIRPTVIETTNPKYDTLCTELFGPVLTVYVYEDDQFQETMKLLDETSDYALTGSIFAKDRYAIDLAVKALENSAGNFYINDKPTGAVVGQQPFGGARGSGTNDKAGSVLNLYRWVSARTIKETFVPPTDYRYPFLG